MNKLNLLTFASVFQKQEYASVRKAHEELFDALENNFEVNVIFEKDLDSHDLDSLEGKTLVFIATGGTEGTVVKNYGRLPKPLTLLTDGKANSLAASLELSCWTRRQGDTCTILHGDMDAIVAAVKSGSTDNGEPAHDCSMSLKESPLKGCRIGVLGEPSDWLVASDVDYELARKHWGVEFTDISLDVVNAYYAEVKDEEAGSLADKFVSDAIACKEPDRTEVIKAMRLYLALQRIVDEEKLDAVTLQCFSLIPTTGTTGCLALALLNDNGIIAGCEGDLSSIFTMLLANRLTGQGAFMANPSHINRETGEILFAHCTIGLKQTEGYIIRTHFESNSGVAIQGIMPTGKVTVMKCGGRGLERSFVASGTIMENQDDCRKCRTQILVKLDNPEDAAYFFNNTIGNHHIIVIGDYTEKFR
ncbi:MAG: fucose isomerase [Bacteroidales bacterium]|nr:fucose isomerase [Bacteroidales bacterium]MCM1147746.1 fucose isomerase [Bacteroidales bacterium]MCM1206644.1 fucose isomerase [Bacillota bacterium]MCM1510615.1 hypothetical protein [Clostridium sp.]